jgi:outer membrane protein, heavy metal efflux system
MKKNIRNISLIFVLMMSIASKGESLENYLQIAAENSASLKAKYAEFEIALARVAQVNTLPEPILSFGYFISPVETRVGPQRAKISLSQMFPWFGTLAAKGEITSLMAEAKYQSFLNAKNQLYHEVRVVWYQLFELNKKVLLQNENREILESFKQLGTASYKNGKGSMVDVLRIDIRIGDIQSKIEILTSKRTPLNTQFNKLLNREATSPIIAPVSVHFKAVEDQYRKDSLFTKHPMLKAYDLKIQSAKTQEVLAQKQGMPKLGLGLDYVFVGERTDMTVEGSGQNVIMPMMSLTLPIYRSKYNAAIKEANLRQEQWIQTRVSFENDLIVKYEQAWFNLERNHELIALYREQNIKTKQVISVLLTAYSNSGKDFEEILRMQQQLLNYQIAETEAIAGYYTAVSMIDYLTAK